MHLLASLAVDVLALSLPIGFRNPHVGSETVAVREDRAFPVRPRATSHAAPSLTRRSMYSSTHSGRMRRCLPSLSERSSPVATSILVLLRPKPSISATWTTLYHFGASRSPERKPSNSSTV